MTSVRSTGTRTRCRSTTASRVPSSTRSRAPGGCRARFPPAIPTSRCADMERLQQIPQKWRGVLAVAVAAVVYLIALQLPGIGPALQKKAPLAVIVIGLITGTVTSLLAIGLILIYRANRFINFAYGAMGSTVGVLGIALYKEHGWPYFVMLPVGVITGVAVGGLIEVGAIRRFAHAPRLLLTGGGIGVGELVGGIELLGAKALGFVSLTGGFSVPINFHLQVGVKTLAGDELLIMIAVPIVITGLAWFLLRTDSGVAVRAAAENSDRALLLGIPVRRLATIVWMIAGGLSALTYLLKAPFSGSLRAWPTDRRSCCLDWRPPWWPGWSLCLLPSRPDSDWASLSRSCAGTAAEHR